MYFFLLYLLESFSRSSYFPVQCQFELMLLRILYTSSKQEIEKDILFIKKKRNKKIFVFMKTIYVVLHQPVPRTNSLVFLLASSSDLCTISSLVCNLKIGDSTVCREVDQSLKNIYILIENEKKRKQLKTTDNWNYQPLIDVPLFFNESTLL